MHNKTVKKKFLRMLGNLLIVPLVKILCKTLRIAEENKSTLKSLAKEKQNIIFAFWHGTMLVPWYILRDYSPSTIISQSKDGDLLVKLLENWKYKVKRGSSSRSGKEVLEELVSEAKNNSSIAITPDGPKGPGRVMKAGAIIIAKKAQIPIVLIGVCYDLKIKLKSWDRFEIPFFFSRVKLIYSEPISIDHNLNYEETDITIKKFSKRLNDYQGLAEKMC